MQSKMFLAGVSLVISVLVWAFVAFDDSADAARTFTAEIKYINAPRGLSLYAPTKNVEMRIAGTIETLSNVQASDIVAEVDLANLQQGKYSLPIRLETPPFAIVRSWAPSVAEVELYREVERTLTITPKTSGEAPEGKIVTEVSLTPEEAVVTGPESDVMAIQELEADVPLDKVGEKGDYDARILIKTTSGQYVSAGDRLSLSPATAAAAVTFENEIVAERIPVKVSVVGEPEEGLQVESVKVIPESVSIRGRSEAVKKVQSLVLPPVDISGLNQDIQIMIPMHPTELESGVEITGTDRARVEISLSKKMATKTFSNVPVRVRGNDDGKEWKISPNNASLTIKGTQAAINDLGNSSNLPCELYIDVSNIVSKQTELPVLVRNLQKDFEVVSVEPERLLSTLVE